MMSVNLVCPICIGNYTTDDGMVSTSCGHIFHNKCLKNWTSSSTTCPTCRQYCKDTIKIFPQFDGNDSTKTAKKIAFKKPKNVSNHAQEHSQKDIGNDIFDLEDDCYDDDLPYDFEDDGRNEFENDIYDFEDDCYDDDLPYDFEDGGQNESENYRFAFEDDDQNEIEIHIFENDGQNEFENDIYGFEDDCYNDDLSYDWNNDENENALEDFLHLGLDD